MARYQCQRCRIVFGTWIEAQRHQCGVSDAPTFGALLRGHRHRAHDWTQRKLAAAVGIVPSHVSRLERGERLPHRELIAAFGAALALDAVEQATLYAAAGYLPPGSEWPVWVRRAARRAARELSPD